MRLLGSKSPLSAFRHDLIYLAASLSADARPDVAALAPSVNQLLGDLRAERELFEQAEDATVIMTARRGRRDAELDELIVTLGGIARSVDKQLYGVLFAKRNPTTIARLGLDKEVVEVDRILGELGKLPEGSALRRDYQGALSSAVTTLRETMTLSRGAEVDLALARSQLDRFKLRADEVRLETHGKLVTLLKDRKEADTFFRPTASAPGTEASPSEAEEKAPPEPPSPAPAPPA
jgi:hypothetical protein